MDISFERGLCYEEIIQDNFFKKKTESNWRIFLMVHIFVQTLTDSDKKPIDPDLMREQN